MPPTDGPAGPTHARTRAHAHTHARTHLAAELDEVDDVERRDVVGAAAEVLGPVPLAPELEPERLLVGVTEGRVAVGVPLQVHVPQLAQVGAHHLVGVHVAGHGISKIRSVGPFEQITK